MLTVTLLATGPNPTLSMNSFPVWMVQSLTKQQISHQRSSCVVMSDGTALGLRNPTIGCFIRPSAVEKAEQMKLGKNVQQVIAAAHPYPEGRWLFIIVESMADMKDIQQLLALRAETKRL